MSFAIHAAGEETDIGFTVMMFLGDLYNANRGCAPCVGNQRWGDLAQRPQQLFCNEMQRTVNLRNAHLTAATGGLVKCLDYVHNHKQKKCRSQDYHARSLCTSLSDMATLPS